MKTPTVLGTVMALAIASGDVAMAAEPAAAPSAEDFRKLIWKRQIGTPKYDSAQGVATDANGNILISGTTEGSLGGASQGDRDAFVAKYSGAGNRLWASHLGSPQHDEALSVAADRGGNVFVAGTTFGDVFLAKYSTEGDRQWVIQIGTAESEYNAAVAIDADNNVLISGTTRGAFAGENPNRRSQAFVAKYTGDGDRVWVKQLGTTTEDTGSLAVATDADGNVLIAGYASGPLAPNQTGGAFVAKYGTGGGLRWVRQFEAGSDHAAGVAADSQGNVVIAVASRYREFVVKYSALGDVLWTDEVGAGTGPRQLTGVTTDADDNVVITGYTYGSIGVPNKGGGDAFVVKYDALGHRLWKRQIGTDRSEWSNGVATDAEGNIVIGGFTDGALGGPNRGLADAFVAKFRP